MCADPIRDFPLEQSYQSLIRFSYTCFDRIVLRGHVPLLQSCGGFVDWARCLVGDEPITDSWIGSLVRRFHLGLKKFAEEHDVPLISAPRKQRKHEVAEEYRAKTKPDATGVYLIIRGREKANLFRSTPPKQPRNPNHRNLSRRWGWVDHYYVYLVDRYWGPISIRFCSHPPFNVAVFLNGNRWLAREIRARGLRVVTKDNSVVQCRDRELLQQLADSLDAAKLQSVCDHWVYRLFPVFTREERIESLFRYSWFFSQVEMSHNMVFKNPEQLTETLERHVDLNRRHLHPRSLKTVFCAKPVGAYRDDMSVSVRHSFGGLTVLDTRYGLTRLKQYNNHQATFRTEACTNNTHELGINKALANLPTLRKRLLELIVAFQEPQETVLHTTCKRGELAALAKPGQVNETRTPGIKLENERIMTVLSALPQLAHQPGGFRSADLRAIVSDQLTYSANQATYDLRKLRGKGLIERHPSRWRYRLTRHGLRVAAFLAKLRHGLLDPVLGQLRTRPKREVDQLPEPDRFYAAIANDLFELSDFLRVSPT